MTGSVATQTTSVRSFISSTRACGAERCQQCVLQLCAFSVLTDERSLIPYVRVLVACGAGQKYAQRCFFPPPDASWWARSWALIYISSCHPSLFVLALRLSCFLPLPTLVINTLLSYRPQTLQLALVRALLLVISFLPILLAVAASPLGAANASTVPSHSAFPACLHLPAFLTSTYTRNIVCGLLSKYRHRS